MLGYNGQLHRQLHKVQRTLQTCHTDLFGEKTFFRQFFETRATKGRLGLWPSIDTCPALARLAKMPNFHKIRGLRKKPSWSREQSMVLQLLGKRPKYRIGALAMARATQLEALLLTLGWLPALAMARRAQSELRCNLRPRVGSSSQAFASTGLANVVSAHSLRAIAAASS